MGGGTERAVRVGDVRLRMEVSRLHDAEDRHQQDAQQGQQNLAWFMGVVSVWSAAQHISKYTAGNGISQECVGWRHVGCGGF